jgi:hypothetical protein
MLKKILWITMIKYKILVNYFTPMLKITISSCIMLLVLQSSLALSPGNKYSYISPNTTTIFSDHVVFHLNVLNPGVSVEANIFGDATIVTGYQYGALFQFNSKEIKGRKNELNFLPQLFLNYRQYYNFRERIIENKHTAMFSADYVGLHLSHVFQSEVSQPFTFAGPIWGLQRHLADFIHINFSLGLGYYFSSEYSDDFNHFNLIADVHIGFSI